MRAQSVVALFLLSGLLIVSGCSGNGQAASSMPALAAGAASSASAVQAVPLLPAPSATAVYAFPSDFPANAVAGARARLASAAWDKPGASSPVVTLSGTGSAGAKSMTYLRADGTAAVGVYFPSNRTVATGWIGVTLRAAAAVALESTANDAADFTDTKPDTKAATSFYFTPTRVLLIELVGTGATPAPHSSATPKPQPSATPKPEPSATPKPQPSAAPPVAADVSSCVHFVTNPVCHQLPANPKISPYSGAWASLEFQTGRNRMSSFNAEAGPHPFTDSSDNSDPPFAVLGPGVASIAQVIDCDQASWGLWACNLTGIQGKTLQVPAAMEPEGNGDHHYSFDDTAAQGEYDFWKVTNLPASSGATLHMGSGGFCKWSGDGTACSESNATNIAGSLGSIASADFTRAEANAVHGTFGHAISFAALCNDTTFVYPASASDGANSNGTPACSGHTGANQRPPEGTRVYLDLTDAQIDAMNLPAYAKAFWRTLDREHEGGFIADTDWSGAPGLSGAFRRDDFASQAREAGVVPAPDAQIPIGLGTINLATELKFCSNGTC